MKSLSFVFWLSLPRILTLTPALAPLPLGTSECPILERKVRLADMNLFPFVSLAVAKFTDSVSSHLKPRPYLLATVFLVFPFLSALVKSFSQLCWEDGNLVKRLHTYTTV